MAKNSNLTKAKKAKNDEFYTQITDIEKELVHYHGQLRDKVVFCNCDDPEWSNFWRYFDLNFDHIGLKGLIATHYDPEKPTYKLEIRRDPVTGVKLPPVRTDLKQNGDFRSPECVELLKECDVVVSNPPFSLLRDYVAQLIQHRRKFIIIGNMNAITYKEIFPLLKNNEMWVGFGFNLSMIFKTKYPNLLESNRKYVISKGYDPDDGYVKTPAICWFTNIDIKKRHEPLTLFRRYYDDPSKYPKYDNYDAINVDKVTDIPEDYDGVMGVPITFLDKYCSEQFEILGLSSSSEDCAGIPYAPWKIDGRGTGTRASVDGKSVYARIFICRKLDTISYVEKAVFDIRRLLEKDEVEVALDCALTLPDMCSEIIHGTDQNAIRYKAWVDENIGQYEIPESKKDAGCPCLTGNVIYDLRNSLKHDRQMSINLKTNKYATFTEKETDFYLDIDRGNFSTVISKNGHHIYYINVKELICKLVATSTYFYLRHREMFPRLSVSDTRNYRYKFQCYDTVLDAVKDIWGYY